MTVLNLGCGYQTSDRCTNIDWSLPVRMKGSRVGRMVAPMILTGDRRTAYDAMDGDVMRHNLKKGIPFADQSVDGVYHSHLLEHLDYDVVPTFLKEVKRVLKPGGVHRIVVPDLEFEARRYIESLDGALRGDVTNEDHEWNILLLIHQMVRKESWGTSQRTGLRRWTENTVLGDARKRGETHQWMYDQVSLPAVLKEAGFVDPKVVSFNTSTLEDWPEYLLDQDEAGTEYRPGSLYVEARA
ncbi:SAM-dependent methyltransferase [Aeromicrobium panaciterrae]|uniref:SAM-dependent methyltransferase n=1 Tax=Aeromicrobium panaciterrae TaxID=363861 RepID=A0ABU1UKN1_9ACTN|nr:methyltransferase domain-containing protein [Aeromicrobium panaciterrae]MDR7085721.1 SAM-dependent methyltransferase [Aeromicrobium panaciterrae]